ncbi:hypothetical protein ACWIUA_07180 [Ursidibacter sp. B-7004-1]
MKILTAYFNSQLVNAGLPDDLEINWSLSYCQGDGVAFYGTLYSRHWNDLFKKIYPGQKRKQRMFERLLKSILDWENYYHKIVIYRNQFGYRYAHFNTMEIDAPQAENLSFFYDVEAKKEWYFSADNVYKYQALWDDFITDLEEYIRDLSKRLESEGYRIIGATPYESEVAYKFETKNYRVELITDPLPFYDHHFETHMYDCDFENIETLCSEALKGQARFVNVYAQVLDKKTGIALGEDYLGSLTYDPKDKSLGGYRQILIREAIKAARADDGLISRQAQLMKKTQNSQTYTSN